jgi:threonine synthase
MQYFSHLECAAQCGEAARDAHERHHLCTCGSPLLARYDLAGARAWRRDSLTGRTPTLWRYRELLPLFDGEDAVTLGEGFTPLVHAERLGRALGLTRLFIKDESLNPTNSFKARGQSAAITRAKYLRARTIALPTAGNAGNAAAAYAAAAGLACEVFIPGDAKRPFIDECLLYGAHVTLIDGLITDAGRIAAETGAHLGWYDVSTLKEPYRIEGKKTMAYELAEQLHWTWPDWIVYPTGGGTGMVGMWKAFDELEQIGWMSGRRPRMVSVQAEGCAPIVRAFAQGLERAPAWEHATTVADGLRVPRAVGDFLILRAIRESGGTAVAVSDAEMVAGMLELGGSEGISAAPEGGAALAAIRRLTDDGTIASGDSVVLFNTGGALKYLDVIASARAASR